MLRALAGLVAELRAVGIPVSPTEHIDAATALRFTPVEDRAAVKAALAATLVKNAEHVAAFSTIFDLYFADRQRALPSAPDAGPTQASEVDSAGGGPGALGGLTDDALTELLFRALRDRDELLQRAIAGVLVDRHAGIEPGRRVAGTYYLFRALRGVDLTAMLGRLRDDAAGPGASLVDTRLAEVAAAELVDAFRAEVENEIRARLVADRGAADVARTLRKPLPEDLDFLNATRVDAAAIRDALRPLARKLATRLARKRRAHRAAPLAFRKPYPARPDLVVLADISGSVATFATFTLQLVHALRSEFARVRTFAFVDGIEEVTALLEKAEDLTDVTRALNRGTSAVWLSGRSDYGHALRTFARQHVAAVHGRSTVLVLGDARSNFLATREESLRVIADRAKALYWLNPERREFWDEGDSVISRYARHCTAVYECRNVRQLRAFVEQLMPA